MIAGVIFDLDGVLTATDELHAQAWAETCSRWGLSFAPDTAKLLRGVGRLAAAHIVAARCGAILSEEAIARFAEEKNERYRGLLAGLTPDAVLPDVVETIAALRTRHIPMAVASASKNARAILTRLGLIDAFDVVVDGTQITRTKPDPEVFALAAARLSLAPASCLVVEDAVSGLEAAKAIGCYTAAIGPDAHGHGADRDIVRIDGIFELLDDINHTEDKTCCIRN